MFYAGWGNPESIMPKIKKDAPTKWSLPTFEAVLFVPQKAYETKTGRSSAHLDVH